MVQSCFIRKEKSYSFSSRRRWRLTQLTIPTCPIYLLATRLCANSAPKTRVKSTSSDKKRDFRCTSTVPTLKGKDRQGRQPPRASRAMIGVSKKKNKALIIGVLLFFSCFQMCYCFFLAADPKGIEQRCGSMFLCNYILNDWVSINFLINCESKRN